MRHEWIRHTATHIQHVSGLGIRLTAGTWAEPMDIDPICPQHLTVDETVRLLREGILWAGACENIANQTEAHLESQSVA